MDRVLVFGSGDCWGDSGLVFGPLKKPEVKKPMSNDNRISAVLAPADKATILQKIKEIAALMPFLATLTPQDRKMLPTLGTARAGMRETFMRHMAEHPEMVPGFVEMDEVTKDANLDHDMEDVGSQIRQLLQSIDDTTTLASHDNYVAFLATYNNVKAAAQRGLAGTDTLLAEEAVFFQHKAAQPATKPTKPTA